MTPQEQHMMDFLANVFGTSIQTPQHNNQRSTECLEKENQALRSRIAALEEECNHLAEESNSVKDALVTAGFDPKRCDKPEVLIQNLSNERRRLVTEISTFENQNNYLTGVVDTMTEILEGFGYSNFNHPVHAIEALGNDKQELANKLADAKNRVSALETRLKHGSKASTPVSSPVPAPVSSPESPSNVNSKKPGHLTIVCYLEEHADSKFLLDSINYLSGIKWVAASWSHAIQDLSNMKSVLKKLGE